MDYTIQIGNDIHTEDIDAYYPLLDFGENASRHKH